MTIEIDQSWKIEKTNKPTVLGLSNDTAWAVVIPRRVKRAALAYLDTKYRHKTLNVLRVFAAGVVVLVQSSKVTYPRLVIDQEYTGYDNDLINLIVQLAQKVQLTIPASDIAVKRIGKASPAHRIAYGVFIKKRTPDKVIAEKELLRLLG